MPPKRKQPPRKKRLVQDNDDQAPGEVVSAPRGVGGVEPLAGAAEVNKVAEKKTVQWAQPKPGKGKSWQHYKKWAQVLFGRRWEELKREKIPGFDDPQLPSPLNEDRTQLSESLDISQELRRLYVDLSNSDENYLANVDDTDAGIATSADFNRELLRGRESNRELRATLVPTGEEDRSASITIIRRTAEDGDVQDFLIVSPNTEVTVNGTTYTNNAVVPVNDSGDDSDNIFIGPLRDFAIIELLHAPVFLWRNTASTNSKIKGQKKLDPREPKPEGARVTIVLSPATEGGDSQTLRNESQSSHVPSMRRPNSDQSSTGKPKTPNQTKNINSANNGLSATPNSNTQASSRPSSNAHSPSRVDVQQAISLYSHVTRLEDFVNPVLLAISELQQDRNIGFCVEVNSDLIRPGQPWILPIRSLRGVVLLVLQCEKPRAASEGIEIKIYVLDPLNRVSNKQAREDIWGAISSWNMLPRWMGGIGLNLQELLTALPHSDSVEWIASPAASNDDEAVAITILNAWALAMGLELNPDWVPLSDTGAATADIRAKFFEKAKVLFHLALAGRELNGEAVCKFLSDEGFVLSIESITDRKFHLSRLPPRSLRKTQTVNRKEYDELIIKLRSAPSRANQSPEERKRLMNRAKLLSIKFAKLTALNTPPRHPSLKRPSPHPPHTTGATGSIDYGPSPKRIKPLPSPTEFKVDRDPFDFPEDETPCGYLAKELERLTQLHRTSYNEDPEDIDVKYVLRSIDSVVQAVAHAEGPDRSLECYDYAKLEPHAPDSAAPVYSGCRLLLLPWTTYNRTEIQDGAERNILVAVQPAKKKGEVAQLGHATVHIYDYAPWYSNQKNRKATYDEVRAMLEPGVAIGASISWITGPALEDVTQQWKFHFYVIMSAWAVALKLELDQDFRPKVDFFDQANLLVNLVLSGDADWKLIWTFLRCHKFVKNKSISNKRRFDRTVPESMLGRSRSQLQSTEVPAGIPKSSRRALHEGSNHDGTLPSDSWTDEAVFHKLIPTLLPRGLRIAHLSLKQLRGWDEILNDNGYLKGKKRELVGTSEDPCKAFRDELGTLKQKYGNGMALARENFGEDNQWVKLGDVGTAIASVTLAITLANEPKYGYSHYSSDTVEYIFEAVDSGELEFLKVLEGKAIPGFGPMIIAVRCSSHIALLIVQLDKDSNPEFLILDSKAWLWSKEERDKLYSTAVHTLQQSSWGTHGSETQLQIPSSARWIDCARQTNDFACGFHTIFNGWAAALGLTVRNDFRKDWKPFHPDAADVVSLAMIGQATVTLIKNFFDCSQFVLPDQYIDREKQFERTTRTFQGLGIQNVLEDSLDELQARDFIVTREEMPHNRVALQNGRPHDITWPCDVWPEKENYQYLPMLNELSKKGCLEPTMDHWQLKRALQMYSEEYRVSHGTNVKGLLDHFLNSQGQAVRDRPSDLVRNFNDYLRIEDHLDPQTINKEALRIYRQNMSYYAEFNNRIKEQYFIQVAMVANNTGYAGGFEWLEMIACVAAVVMAVDRHQDRGASYKFRGGFAFASARSLQRAVAAQDEVSGNRAFEVRVSRPRRCWLLPYELVGNDAHGRPVAHNFLAVLQEENVKRGGSSKFCVYFLDSKPEHLKKRQDEIYTNIKQLAQVLKWTTPGDKNGGPKFRASPRFVKVTEQRKGVNACSDHTVLNAWILALGLTPVRGGNSTLPFEILKELRQMMNVALIGVLDWKTLVAWLICRNLTIERTAKLVPEDRRFRATSEQLKRSWIRTYTGDPDQFFDRTNLDDDIQSIVKSEDHRRSSTEEITYSYDFSNNVDFSRSGFEVETDQDEEEEEYEPQQLDRADDDMDDLVYTDSSSDLQYYQDLAQHGWEERQYHQRCARRNRWLRQIRVQGRLLGIR